jgi:hypothetical protein
LKSRLHEGHTYVYGKHGGCWAASLITKKFEALACQGQFRGLAGFHWHVRGNSEALLHIDMTCATTHVIQVYK